MLYSALTFVNKCYTLHWHLLKQKYNVQKYDIYLQISVQNYDIY